MKIHGILGREKVFLFNDYYFAEMAKTKQANGEFWGIWVRMILDTYSTVGH